MGSDKLIIRSEKARLTDILSLLLLRRPFTSYPFVEAGDQTVADLGSTPGGWFLGLTLLIQKFLCAIYWPSWCIGVAVEFLLNFVALNSGILGIIWNIFRCKLVIPWDREAPEFRSIIGLIDRRTELKPQPPPASSRGDHHERRRLQVVGISGNRGVEECAGLESGERGNATTTTVPLVQQRYSLHEVTVMAAKIAYENAAYIENVVNNVWKFHFVGFYSCWNKFMWKDGAYTTQAFVMTESSSDARVVVVSFRGTELFNTRDWSTDVDLSWLGLGAMGCVHVGFLKALGLQEEDDVDPARAFPRDLPNNDAAAAAVGNNERPVAYYKLREVLREQLKKHPRARVVVTGHSLGGALAAIFPALLAFHGEGDVLRRLLAVHTYGQPRVGDAAFAAFCRGRGRDPIRVVYRYDLIPRVPWDLPPLARFRHGGACVYFDGWYRGRELPAGADVPNRNYVDPGYLLPMYGEAAADLVRGAFLWVWEGRDYREGAASLLFRAAGLVVPGVASHSPRDCVNAVRLGRVARKEA